jgi:hypothetical protein
VIARNGKPVLCKCGAPIFNSLPGPFCHSCGKLI